MAIDCGGEGFYANKVSEMPKMIPKQKVNLWGSQLLGLPHMF